MVGACVVGGGICVEDVLGQGDEVRPFGKDSPEGQETEGANDYLRVEVGTVAARVIFNVAVLVCALVAYSIFHCGRVCPLQGFGRLAGFSSIYCQRSGLCSNLVRRISVICR